VLQIATFNSWSWAEIDISFSELSKFMTNRAAISRGKAMLKVMNHCASNPERGTVQKSNMNWNGDPEFKLVIIGSSDSNFVKDPATRKSVSGTLTFLCGAPIMQKNPIQKIIALSATKAELVDMT